MTLKNMHRSADIPRRTIHRCHHFMMMIRLVSVAWLVDEEVVSLFFYYDENEMMWKCSFPLVSRFFFWFRFATKSQNWFFSRARRRRKKFCFLHTLLIVAVCSAVLDALVWRTGTTMPYLVPQFRKRFDKKKETV